MQHADTIIVGGGPAGSTCAWRLNLDGRDVMILERQQFPRVKLCAGWITAKVMQDLQFSESDYPGGMLKLKIRTHLPYLPLTLPGLPTPGANYSISRREFDNWLLKRAGVPVVPHTVRTITRRGPLYVIDDRFTCHHLVGAGGTMCPVRRSMFPDNRRGTSQIATLEKEFRYRDRQDTCHLYFCFGGLKGYAWYVPKADGAVNIGIGGKSRYFSRSGTKIHDHFRTFLSRLVREGRIDQQTVNSLQYSGHPYYLASFRGEVQKDNCYLVGDAAGLATLDLGEGIGPAIESGLLAAAAVQGKAVYSRASFTKYSTGGITKWMAARLLPVRGTENPPATSIDVGTRERAA
ncbi:MAG: NAD(P)/FAD-dependent oxidoreductase [Fuerstiella sp.]